MDADRKTILKLYDTAIRAHIVHRDNADNIPARLCREKLTEDLRAFKKGDIREHMFKKIFGD